MIRIYSKQDVEYGDVYETDNWGVWDRLDECKRYETVIRREATDVALTILFFVSLALSVLYLFGYDFTSQIWGAIISSVAFGLIYYCGGLSAILRYKRRIQQEAVL